MMKPLFKKLKFFAIGGVLLSVSAGVALSNNGQGLGNQPSQDPEQVAYRKEILKLENAKLELSKKRTLSILQKMKTALEADTSLPVNKKSKALEKVNEAIAKLQTAPVVIVP